MRSCTSRGHKAVEFGRPATYTRPAYKLLPTPEGVRVALTLKFRKQANRALFGAVSVSATVVGGSTVLWVYGTGGVRDLAAIVGHACARIWTALPPALQVLLIASLVAGVAPLILWISLALEQWQRTRRVLRSLNGRAHSLSPRQQALLERLKLASRVRIIRNDRPFAMTAGFLTPTIHVSTALLETLENDELEAVLLHEQHHLQQYDPLQLLAGRALATAFFFVPLIRLLIQRHHAAVELAADEYAAARQLGTASLSSAMLKLLSAQAGRPAMSALTGMTRLRLIYLLEQRPSLPAISRAGIVQSGAAAAVMAAPALLAHGAAAILAQAFFLIRCSV